MHYPVSIMSAVQRQCRMWFTNAAGCGDSSWVQRPSAGRRPSVHDLEKYQCVCLLVFSAIRICIRIHLYGVIERGRYIPQHKHTRAENELHKLLSTRIMWSVDCSETMDLNWNHSGWNNRHKTGWQIAGKYRSYTVSIRLDERWWWAIDKYSMCFCFSTHSSRLLVGKKSEYYYNYYSHYYHY